MENLDTTTLVIGEEPQYFFDNGIIETSLGLMRTIHSPKKIDANPVIQRDQPWEHVTYFSCNSWTLWRDRESSQFRCLYTDWKIDRDRVAERGGSIVDWDNARLRQLYAHSEDGIDWIKPPMGIQDEAGHNTNIVFGTEDFGSAYDFTPLEVLDEPDPKRRFRSLFTYIPRTTPSTSTGVRVAFSPDGIRWTVADRSPTFGKQGSDLGDVTITDYDPVTRSYLLFTRHPWQGRGPRPGPAQGSGIGGTPGYNRVVGVSNRRNTRRVFLSESADFFNWSEPRIVIAPDPHLDNLDDAFYGMTPLRLGGQWVGFLNCFHMVDNTMNVELTHSRDGRSWHRVRPTHPWLDLGPEGAFDRFMVNMPSRPVEVGDEVFIFYGGAKNHHDWWFAGPSENKDQPHLWSHAPEVTDRSAVGYHLGLAKLRRDGYVSLDAHREREGMLATQPFIAGGDRLIMNAACGPDGYIKVEAADASENVLAGRGRDDCDTFSGDAVEHTVSWRGDQTFPMPSQAEPGGRTPYRRLRFIMRDAQLYGFHVARSSGPE